MNVELPDESLSPCRCDGGRISQVLGILLDNGASYVPAGGKIRLGVEEKEKYFRIYVEDNGTRGFRMRVRKQCSRDFTGRILPPGRISSILDLGFALQRRS